MRTEALVALDDSRYQEASDAINSAILPSPHCMRVLAWLRAEVLITLGRPGEAAVQLKALLAEWAALTHDEQVSYSLSHAAALAEIGDYAHSAMATQSVLAVTSPHGWILERVRAYRLTAEAEYAQGSFREARTRVTNAIAELETSLWWQYLMGEGDSNERLLWFVSGPRGRLFTEFHLLQIISLRIQAEFPGDDSRETLEKMDETASFLRYTGSLTSWRIFWCGRRDTSCELG